MKATTAIHPSADLPIYDTIISGAGLVGLFLACELALAGCSVLILEKTDDPYAPLKQVPFGIRGLSAPTIEALYRRDLLKELELHKRLQNPHQHNKEGSQRQRGHFAGIPFLEGNIDSSRWTYRLPDSTETSLLSEMAELETALARRAEALGVQIKRGRALSGFHQAADSVTIQSDEESFTGKWLVGCDGSRSAVRRIGGFEFAGTEPEFTGYSSHVTVANPQVLKPGRNMTLTGMYLQSQPGYVIIQDFDGGAFHVSGQPVTRDHLQEVLRRVSNTDVTISALHTATTWTDRARQATAYRNGRVLLAGDAAHIHSPLGGQGLNLGLGDAMNLGWKLAATIQGRATDNMLDSYYTERHPIGELVLDWSRAQVAIMKPDPGARALHAIIRDLIDTRDGATYFAGRAWGVFTHYELSGKHPLTGYSIPNFRLDTGRTIGELMRDGRGILLDFTEGGSLRGIAEGYHELNYVTGSVEYRLGIRMALIRPDGVVAWAAEGEHDFDELQAALTSWFSARHPV